jgi:maleylacetate reductase
MAKISKLFGGVSAARGLYDLARNNGAPYSLKQLGMKEEDLEKAADLALKTPYPNPAPLERDKLLQMLRNAYNGVRPE